MSTFGKNINFFLFYYCSEVTILISYVNKINQLLIPPDEVQVQSIRIRKICYNLG